MIFEVILFILLSPGLLLTLPPVGKSYWMTMKTSVAAIFVHAFIFAVLLYFKKYLPIVGSYEGFADASGNIINPQPQPQPQPQPPQPVLPQKRDEIIITAHVRQGMAAMMGNMRKILKSVPNVDFNKITEIENNHRRVSQEAFRKADSVKCN
jgi:hypothetical protein